jgi:hypothetical protein
MGLLRRKTDPLSDRARELSSEIASLEQKIRAYENNLQRLQPPPGGPGPRNDFARGGDLNLEQIGRRPLADDLELERDIVHVNELGVQKYDLPGLVSRVRGFFRAPTTSNPKLVSYLAAGGIQGLRPLRYEKRVARNRFIFFALILLLLLIGLLTVFVPR